MSVRAVEAGKTDQSFPKRVRILRPAGFRRVYAEGLKISGPYFAAFCLRRAEPEGPKIGFTAPRALGKAVVRNRIKRRMREAVRRQLFRLEPQWEIVFNPRRSVLGAPAEDLAREIERLFSRCKQ
jgi:ribonuclease P protein component